MDDEGPEEKGLVVLEMGADAGGLSVRSWVKRLLDILHKDPDVKSTLESARKVPAAFLSSYRDKHDESRAEIVRRTTEVERTKVETDALRAQTPAEVEKIRAEASLMRAKANRELAETIRVLREIGVTVTCDIGDDGVLIIRAE